MRYGTLALALWLAVSAGASSAQAKGKLYVDIGGNAGDGDGTELNPFKSIAAGLFKTQNPGDQLFVRHGLYAGSLRISGMRGSRGEPIVIRGDRQPIPAAEANQPNVSQAKYCPVIRPTQKNALEIVNSSNLVIEGFIFEPSKEYGIYLENCEYVTIRNCDITDCVKSLIKVKGGRHISVENCTLSGSVLEHGVHYWMSDEPRVAFCRIFQNSLTGVFLQADKLSGGPGMVATGVIEGNTLYANGRLKEGGVLPTDERGRPIRPQGLRFGAAAISADGPKNCVFMNNVIHHNFNGGICLFRATAENFGTGNRVWHNTIYLPASTQKAYGIQLAVTTSGTQVRNNIIVTAEAPCLWIGKGGSSGMQSDYNVFGRKDDKESLRHDKDDLMLQRWQNIYRLDRNSMRQMPVFVDPDNEDLAKCDFHLNDNSLVRRCLPEPGVPLDIEGKFHSRNQVTAGAYEARPSSTDPRGGQAPQPPPRQPTQPPKPPDDKPPDNPGPGPIILPPLD
ncbi:MAG: hypothetical protein BIFFINMI_02420 [Phycisphaerae bacterium]|nr:hypothetical protein [Phycisphaerae bacterium]